MSIGLNSDIDGRLRGIRQQRYAQTFCNNAIDADVLRDLTVEHLLELAPPLGAGASFESHWLKPRPFPMFQCHESHAIALTPRQPALVEEMSSHPRKWRQDH